MTRWPANMAFDDPVTQYAQLVLDGTIVQGPYVRLACRRHLDWLQASQDPAYPYEWRPDLAQIWIDFFPDLLTVEEAGETVPFHLLDWQIFVAGSINGWRWRSTGYRLFTRAYVEGGKGCGKSPFAGGIGLLMLCADGEVKSEVYSAAAKKDQAHILFQDAVSMKKGSPILNSRLVESGKSPVWQLSHRPTGSKFKPLAADKQQSGLRPHCVLVDELHEHKDRYVIDMATAAFKGRRHPLLFVITNSGFDKESICYEWHQDAVEVLEGTRTNDALFAFVLALDPDDDPLKDESCWVKTNPGLGITITEQYLRDQVRDARQVPGRENVVRRLNFCQWTNADEGWMTREAWEAIEEKEGLTDVTLPDATLQGGGYHTGVEFDGAELYVGLDLAFSHDLTALAFAFPEGENILAWIEYFKPLATLEEAEKRDKQPYRKWIRQGLIRGVPGPVIRKEYIAQRIADVRQQFDLRWAAYDNYAHKSLRDEMIEKGVIGVPWIEHPQGFRRGGALRDSTGRKMRDPTSPDGDYIQNPLWMPESVRNLEQRILEKTIIVQPSPVTRWQVSSAVIRQDAQGNRIFDKAKANGRIDGIVALAMAVAAADMLLPVSNLDDFLKNPVIA